MNLVCDLGTSHVRAAVVGGNRLFNEPCVIAHDNYGKTMVGAEAERMIGRNPAGVNVITPVEGGVIRNMEAAVELIRQCIGRLGQRRLTRKFELTISVPSGLTQVETKALEDAGHAAGARRVRFVNASVAAALAAGLPVDEPTGCLVMDLGAGVTEASLLSLNGIVASHLVKVGGKTIDEAIIERVKNEYGFLLGLRTAEACKRQLCSDISTSSIEVRGRNLRTGLPSSLVIDRSIVDEEITAYTHTIVELIGEAISNCPPELVGDVVDRGIVLVGGGANITGLVRQLTDNLSVPVVVAEQPETSVIRGLLAAEQKRGNAGASLRQMQPLKDAAVRFRRMQERAQEKSAD